MARLSVDGADLAAWWTRLPLQTRQAAGCRAYQGMASTSTTTPAAWLAWPGRTSTKRGEAHCHDGENRTRRPYRIGNRHRAAHVLTSTTGRLAGTPPQGMAHAERGRPVKVAGTAPDPRQRRPGWCQAATKRHGGEPAPRTPRAAGHASHSKPFLGVCVASGVGLAQCVEAYPARSCVGSGPLKFSGPSGGGWGGG